MKTLLSLLIIYVLTGLSGCTSLAVIGHSGGKEAKGTRIDKVYSVMRSPNGDYVACINGRSAHMDKNQDFSLLLPKELIEDAHKQRTENRPQDIGNVFSIKSGVGPACIEGVSQFDEWVSLPLSYLDHNPNSNKLDDAERYPSSQTGSIAYVEEKWDAAQDKWGLYNLVVVHDKDQDYTSRLLFRMETFSIDSGSEELALIPVAIAVDSVTLPLQALWVVVSGVAMSGSK